MRHVTARHEQPIVAHAGHAATALGAGVHRHMLANTVARADLKPGLFALELQVLGNFPDASEGKNHALLAYQGFAADHDMAFQFHPIAKPHLRPDMAKRPNPTALPDLRPLLDNRRGVNMCLATLAHAGHSLGKSIIAVNSASQAISPSTSATPAKRQTLPPGLPRVVVIFISSTSPGTTMRRNLHFSMAMK